MKGSRRDKFAEFSPIKPPSNRSSSVTSTLLAPTGSVVDWSFELSKPAVSFLIDPAVSVDGKASVSIFMRSLEKRRSAVVVGVGKVPETVGVGVGKVPDTVGVGFGDGWFAGGAPTVFI